MKWSETVPGTIPAWVAETDFRLPPSVESVLVRAVTSGDVGYRPSDETSPLRASWSRHLATEWGVDVDPDSVFGVPGVVTGLYASIRAFTKPGGEVVVTTPVYAPFLDAPGELGRHRVDVPLVDDGSRWRLDLDGIDRAFAGGARLLLLCHPHNPTGTVFERSELVELARIAAQRGAVVVSDEVHAPVTYAGTDFCSYAEVAGPEHCVVLVSMSKAMSFAGLLCGAAIVGAAWRDEWLAIPRRLRSGPSLLGVLATEAALEPPAQEWLRQMVTLLGSHRDRLAATLDEAFPGVVHRAPEAGYLYWADFSDTSIAGDPVAAFADVGLRVETGNYFVDSSSDDYAGHVRINFGTSDEIFTEMLDRITAAGHAHDAATRSSAIPTSATPTSATPTPRTTTPRTTKDTQ
ncbi:putative cystathionine beta-lyase [Ilumatobacter coccineus YM16-304]|uniref:cysteine-S-conjugate beta-lyase n=2 Tax=Ilumatobacter coccineus TaxID=467094 RepID=A0A6C7ED41_ILUCY|nr:putative cystathionine beta-lyase [Ilumatobacter coccineus YM16-304]